MFPAMLQVVVQGCLREERLCLPLPAPAHQHLQPAQTGLGLLSFLRATEYVRPPLTETARRGTLAGLGEAATQLSGETWQKQHRSRLQG